MSTMNGPREGYKSAVPDDDRSQLDSARIEIISYESELPAFATRDPSKGPFSRGVLDEVSTNAKKDGHVKREAEERGHPFLNAEEGTPLTWIPEVLSVSWRPTLSTLTSIYSRKVCSAGYCSVIQHLGYRIS